MNGGSSQPRQTKRKKDTKRTEPSYSVQLSKTAPTKLGSGSLSSPMREHRNFAQFYCISVTNFSTVSECILLEFTWIKKMFSSHSYGCFYVCTACTSKNRQLIFYGRYLPFVCPVPITRSETWTKTVDVFIHSVTKPYVLYTAICGITGSETECWFQWCKCRGLLQTFLVARTHFKPQNALKGLKYPPSKWSWIRTLLNEVRD